MVCFVKVVRDKPVLEMCNELEVDSWLLRMR